MPSASTHSEYSAGGGPSEYTPYSSQLQPYGFAQSYPSLPQPFASPQQTVQPHINPRFAEKFGLNFDMMEQQQPYFAYDQYETMSSPVYSNGAEGGWDGQWGQGYDAGEERGHEQGQNGQGT